MVDRIHGSRPTQHVQRGDVSQEFIETSDLTKRRAVSIISNWGKQLSTWTQKLVHIGTKHKFSKSAPESSVDKVARRSLHAPGNATLEHGAAKKHPRSH